MGVLMGLATTVASALRGTTGSHIPGEPASQDTHRLRANSGAMNTMNGPQEVSVNRHPWRRRFVALGSAAAIALGGMTFVSPAEAQAAGVQRPTLVVVQPSTPTVVDGDASSPKGKQ